MSDAILVLNAGSSSLKFTAFLVSASGALDAGVSGNLEELYGRARFRARDASGAALGAHAWNAEAPPAHAGALAIVWHRLDHREARPAIGTRDEWIAIAAVRRVEQLRLAGLAQCDVG